MAGEPPLKYQCPYCRHLLVERYCATCRHEYPLVDGAVSFLRPELLTRRFGTKRLALAQTLGRRLDRWRLDEGERLKTATAAMHRQFIDFAGLADAAGTLLDIGCGEGRLRELLPATIIYHGLDPAPPAERPPSLTIGIGELLPFPDQSIDFVISTAALDYAYDHDALLAEIRRVLRPGGLAAFEVGTCDMDMNALVTSRAGFVVRSAWSWLRGQLPWRMLRKVVYRALFFRRMHMRYFTVEQLRAAVNGEFVIDGMREHHYEGARSMFIRVRPK